MLAIAGLADDPQKPTAKAASVQAIPPPKAEPEPEPEQLASFRGGGPTDQSCAKALPPEIAARPVDFRGRVLGPSGNGIAGARLSLITDAWSLPEQQAVSGQDGTFHFAKTVGDFWRNFAKGGSAVPLVQAVVLATHESFGAAWVNLRVVAKDGKPALGGEYPLTLRMVADRPIEGRLLDDQGKPIAGAVVRVEQLYAVPRGDLSPIIDALRKFDLKPYQTLLPADLAQQSRSPDGDSHRDHRRRRPVHAQGCRSRPPGQLGRDRPADGLRCAGPSSTATTPQR